MLPQITAEAPVNRSLGAAACGRCRSCGRADAPTAPWKTRSLLTAFSTPTTGHSSFMCRRNRQRQPTRNKRESSCALTNAAQRADHNCLFGRAETGSRPPSARRPSPGAPKAPVRGKAPGRGRARPHHVAGSAAPASCVELGPSRTERVLAPEAVVRLGWHTKNVENLSPCFCEDSNRMD
jgi:hypothetical protein